MRIGLRIRELVKQYTADILVCINLSITMTELGIKCLVVYCLHFSNSLASSYTCNIKDDIREWKYDATQILKFVYICIHLYFPTFLLLLKCQSAKKFHEV